MINLTREEAQQVLDALMGGSKVIGTYEHEGAIETLRARLSEPEPETDVELINRGCRYTTELTQPEPEPVANARLIAAAPNLLAELQNIANANPREWDAEVRDQFQQWAQNRARAAIAKATGEQQ
jgi:hypothetical protein